MKTMMRTCQIQRTNEPDLVVVGEIIVQATGYRYCVQVVRTAACNFILVVGDYREGWQTAHQVSSFVGLLHTLRSFTPVPTVRSLVNGWPDSEHRDLLGTVDSVLREVVA